MAVNINVVRFFDIYNSDAALRQRLADAEAMYPGSLEIRDAVVEDVLLPVAEEYGLPFSIDDLREYENSVKRRHMTSDSDQPEEGPVFWLLDHGWENNEAKFCHDKNENE